MDSGPRVCLNFRNVPFIQTVVSIYCIFYVLKISHFRKYWRYMENLKAQSLGKSLNLKMVGFKLEHLDSGLVKSGKSTHHIFFFQNREKKFRK